MAISDSNIVNIPVIGLDGQKSRGSLSDRLRAIVGIEDINIDIRAGKISFRVSGRTGYDGQVQRVIEEIKKAGLTIPVRQEQVDIFNLRCASCVSAIENGLKKIPGISGARVNLATQSGQVKILEGVYDRRRLIDDIRRIGYEADFQSDKPPDAFRATAVKLNLAIALLCAAAIFAFHFGQHILGLYTIRPGISAAVQLILTLPVLYAGREFFIDAILQLRRIKANMNSLIALGSGVAFIYSLAVTIGIFIDRDFGQGTVYYETTAMIIAFILIGRFLEEKATREARDAAEGMSSLIPQRLLRLTADGREEEIPIDRLNISEIVVVRPGQSIPADGVVIGGETTVDESMITGEAMPVSKKTSDNVTGGTVNIGNGIKIKVTQIGQGTTLARMIRMVREAQGHKAPIQRVADKVASVFVPIVILAALVTLVLWVFISPGSKMVLTAPVAVLLVACPCAMGLATPTAILVGTGRAARMGILFRSGEILERLTAVDTFVFDKTGTLTEGRPMVDKVVPTEDTAAETLVQYAASAEQYSEHPFGIALRDKARRDEIRMLNVDKHEIVPGRGLVAEIRGHRVFVGQRSFVAEAGLAPEHREAMHNIEKDELAAVVHVVVDGKYMGGITFSDTLKNGAAETIEYLDKMRHETIMLTGDNNYSASKTAGQLNIKHFEANALPDNKLFTIRSLRRTGRVTAMVGDGVNDAAALAAADIGFSLGTGTDIAVKASDITITGKSLSAVVTAIRVSRETIRIIKQNLFWAFFYNVIMIPVAAGILYPVFGWTLSPALAAAAMALSSISVVINSLRLKKLQPVKAENSEK